VAATTTAAGAASEQPLDRKTILALVAMGVAVFIVANDFTALAVALPAIEKQFNTDVGTVQWVINAYALTFGVLIVVGGRLADIFGRKRIFILGAAIFASFSVLGGVAQDTAWLIACRALMGIGGAMMWPAILGMTFAALPESRAGLAGGLILGAAGIGNAVGPMFGGVLTDALSWRWIFFVNVPIAAFGVLATWLAIHQHEPEPTDRRIDYGGVATLSLGLVALLVALDQVTDWGWGDVRIIALLAICVVMLVGFGLIERKMNEAALIPRDVIANRDFATACLAVLLISAVFFSTLLYLPQFMQKILGYSPLGSGVGLVPMMGTFALTSFVAGPLYTKLGAKLIVSLGAGAIFVGILLLSLVSRDSGRDARARRRHRPVLLVDHDRQRDRARRLARGPRRRHRLHVPDRRWLSRPRAEHDDLHIELEEQSQQPPRWARSESHSDTVRSGARNPRRDGVRQAGTHAVLEHRRASPLLARARLIRRRPAHGIPPRHWAGARRAARRRAVRRRPFGLDFRRAIESPRRRRRRRARAPRRARGAHRSPRRSRWDSTSTTSRRMSFPSRRARSRGCARR
jgi:EmrB/QacA subfamily drug resistance transporter